MIKIIRVTDSEGREVGYLPIELRAGNQTPVIVLQVRPDGANSMFRSTSSAAARVLARRTGSGDSFVDLAAGISLAGETPDEPINFDVKGEADEGVTGQVFQNIWFGVVSSSGAGYKS